MRLSSRRLVDDVNVYDIRGDPRDIDWDGRACRRERVIGYGSVVGSESGVRSSDIVVVSFVMTGSGLRVILTRRVVL